MVAPARATLRADRLRTLNVPRSVSVELNADGVPTKVWRSKDNGGGHGGQEETAAVVETILEMWRIDDEWWRQTISRLYFEAMLEGGKRVILFQDLNSGSWFMQQP